MTLSVKPLDAPLGAEIVGLDVRNITSEDRKDLHQALLDHHLLVIRNQPTSDADLVELGKSFGPIVKARLVSPLTGRDDIMVISNIREDGKPVGQLPDGEMAFHIDQIYRPNPCKAAALHAVEIPSAGGDTMFSNNVRAYEQLPDSMKKRLQGLMATHSFHYGETLKENRVASPDRPQYTHPLVRRIPENDKRALAVCRLMTDRIEGIPEEESRALIEELCDRLEDRGNVYSHEWRVGDILIWDNRCTSHARTDFPTTERRLMKRVTIGDTQPPLA
ncbi:MAG: TauD/TfdA dioxygenase family protein [Beijerinckiaceae bacterium]